MGNSSGQGGSNPPPPVWYPPRYNVEDDRPAESSEATGAPWSIDQALREKCRIPGEVFFVVAFKADGEVLCCSSSINNYQLESGRFFNQTAFIDEVQHLKTYDQPKLNFGSEMGTSVLEGSRTNTRGQVRRRASTIDSCADEDFRRPKKRQRNSGKQNGTIVQSGALTAPQKGIRIGDDDACWGFYDYCFRFIQQTACKAVAKAWIKHIAPKKQSTHPYTRGIESRPDWWPLMYCKHADKIWKPMRHKEPDHIGKDERTFLLFHILRLVMQPKETQHEAIRNSGVDLYKLEAITMEALSSWFNDKDGPGNKSKKPLIKDLFKVARVEERYRNNEIDDSTEVIVQDSSEYGDPDYDDEEDLEPPKFTPAPSGTSSIEPSGPPILPQIHATEHTETGHFPSNSFPPTVDMRAAQYSHSAYDPKLYERANYVEGSGLDNHHAPNYNHSHLGMQEMYPSPQGTSRRSSVFTPPDYGSPAAPAYASWQTSNTSSNPPIYSFQPQPPSVQAFGGQMAQGPPYPTSSLEGLPRQAVDTHGDLFVARPVGQSTIQHQPAYPDYVATEGASLGPANVKAEGVHNPSTLH
ncbi:hypothetical protein F5Y10DRAFT_262113 [Nemania abortiva]|nr:hypothetical protein F5Y10DRAFT_262113 [Nemania abortiva]